MRVNPLGLQLGVTAITYAGLYYLLLAEQGRRAESRWILVASVAVLIAVAWMGLRGRSSADRGRSPTCCFGASGSPRCSAACSQLH